MNALTNNLEHELHHALDAADADPDVKVIILTGSGRAFCSGRDQEAAPGGTRKTDPKGKTHADFIDQWHRSDALKVVEFTHMWRVGTPIIAAVNGWALGAGFWYQLAADITIASDQAVFAQPEVRHVSATSFMFTYLCGWKAANRWGLTGDHFDAQEALRIGMVNEVVPHEELMSAARALAKRLALVPRPSLRLNKAISMQGMQAAGMHAGLLVEGPLAALVHASHTEERQRLLDIQAEKGTRAFLEARDAPFQPEPMGPRSAKGLQKRKVSKKETS